MSIVPSLIIHERYFDFSKQQLEPLD